MATCRGSCGDGNTCVSHTHMVIAMTLPDTCSSAVYSGGQWASSADATEPGSNRQGPQPALPVDANSKRKSTPAMGVQDFLDRGHGGAQLPRKKQDRKDMEKSKRDRGQSSHAAWKSEAEMVLRQQYD